ncbi:ABC transporter substrate-binding protein [Pseudonocardia kujensis]|uniref:ABC transporter substrate-binding protein n=1 Tax=Pseudonocardia kujensis TaxID=1128675 RepID=UPI001E442EFF|nr:ABC transporter substrate-binding protein [Pseudonocardia kujensis]MCE0763660.1 ABC transporter substrate-binding protein [Pseudonocardia kujensis]
MKRLLTSLLAVAALGLAACSSGGSAGSDGPVDLSTVTLKVGDQAGIQQALLEASGALQGAPYKVEWAQFPAAAPVLEALRGKAVDIGVAGDAPTLTALSSTDDIKIVAATKVPQQYGLSLIVPKDSPIRSVADLRGRTVSPTTQGSVGHYLLLQALKEAGLTDKDVTVSFLQPVDAAAAMSSGAIDAWATWDPYTAVAQQEQGARVLRGPDGLAPGLTFLDANTDALSDAGRKQAMQDFVSRYGRAVEWAAGHPAENAAIYTKLTQRPAAVADLMSHRANRSLVPLDQSLVGEIQTVADDYQAYGVLRKKVEVSEAVQDLSPANAR